MWLSWKPHGNDNSNASELHPNRGTFLFLSFFAKFCHVPRLLVGNANPGTSVPEAGEGSGVEIRGTAEGTGFVPPGRN